MMSSARKIIEIQPYRTARAFIAWRSELEAFCTATGLRPMLEPVTENRWLECFEAGDTPEDAAQREFLLVED